jgi:hypothetical protein
LEKTEIKKTSKQKNNSERNKFHGQWTLTGTGKTDKNGIEIRKGL